MFKLDARQLRFLKELFPEDGLLLAPEQTAVFGTDASRRQGLPLAVARPRELSQIQALLRFAQEERLPVYPRGRGTNTVGACVPLAPGLVVSTAFMNQIVEISSEDFLAVVEPGVVTAELQEKLKLKRLFYPPDPASLRFCSIGGNVSTSAGGMRAVKYGVTRDYVLGLTLVLPGGEVLHLGSRTHKNVVGLDLTRLVVGAQGTLGFVAEIILKLLPLPQAQATLSAAFASLEQALEAAGAVFASGILPTAMEFMSFEVLQAVAKLTPAPWPEATQAVLLFKLDGTKAGVAAESEALREVLAASGAVGFKLALTPEEKEKLWEPRRLISPASFQVAPNKISNDITVPRGQIGQAVQGAREIGQRLGLAVLVFGHLGDGNLHVNFMFDAAVKAQADKAQAAKREILELAVGLGGTLSGEHGVGLEKLEYLPLQLSQCELDLMRKIKAVFDPCGIMNPGKAY